MIITINNIPLNEWNIKETKIIKKTKQYKKIIKKNEFYTKIFLAAGAISTGDFSGLEIIIDLFKEFAYYVGMGYAIWGSIEYAMDNPAGADKAKRAVIGFIGVYVIPVIFGSIKRALG